MAITFDLTGDAYDKLNKIIAACNDGKPAMNTIGRVLSSRIRLGFKNSQSPYGDRWKPITYRQGQPLRQLFMVWGVAHHHRGLVFVVNQFESLGC